MGSEGLENLADTSPANLNRRNIIYGIVTQLGRVEDV